MSRQNINTNPINDNDYFEDENLAHLPADHPLMAPLQNALQKTLEKEHEKVHLRLIERQADVKKLEREKEDTAVELYEVQQNLAEMHLTLDQTHQNYNLIQKLRIDAEQKLAILNQHSKEKKEQTDHLERNLLKTSEELTKLSRTLKEIETYNQQMKSEIAVTRRTTYRAEENIGLQEKNKKEQDFLIDNLTEQKKKINEQIIILEAQLLAQKDESKAARDILKEAQIEMENITVSKRNLLDRWQKSLLEMQRRDKALQVAREALKVQFEINVRMTSELAGISNDIKDEARTSENLSANLSKLRLEEKRLDDEKFRLEHEQHKLNAQIKILQQSLESTEISTQGVVKEIKKYEDQLVLIEDNIMKMHMQAQSVIEQVINRINEHKTLEKKSASSLKQAQMVEKEIEDKEIEKENAENEMARVNIDTLNTRNQIETLQKKKREVSEDRKKKEETVATYELEIRQGHDINEKKQSEVGKLNKLHDEIVNNASEMSRAPMDAHRTHLLNQIKEKGDQNQTLERDWIKKQTNLVKHTTHFNKIKEEIGTMSTKKTILQQKKMRLNTIYKGHEKEIQEVKIALKNLQTEMNKLNDGISKNQENEIKLKNENFHVQSDFLEKLKELENTNVKLEFEIDRIKEEKAELLESIVEAERQMLLWERKIQLEKEIQNALDPDVGQTEIKSLQKDIHRMELRLDELRKRQEQTIQEMERAVYKRETIQLKYTRSEDITVTEPKKVRPHTTNQVTRQIDTLRTTLAQTTKNSKEYDKRLKELQAQIDQKNQLMDGAEHNLVETEEDVTYKTNLLNQKRLERIVNVFEVVKNQTKYKAYDSIAMNKFKLDATENLLRQKYEKQRDMNASMINIFEEIANTYPQYAEIVSSLASIRVD